MDARTGIDSHLLLRSFSPHPVEDPVLLKPAVSLVHKSAVHSPVDRPTAALKKPIDLVAGGHNVVAAGAEGQRGENGAPSQPILEVVVEKPVDDTCHEGVAGSESVDYLGGEGVDST